MTVEFFKFRPLGDPAIGGVEYLIEGEMLNDISTAVWIERYREPGEFKLTAPVSSGLRTIAPIGTVISHIDTLEPMIIENHEIDEEVEGSEPTIVLSGRSFETWLDQRNVAENFDPGGADDFLTDYVLAYDIPWVQAALLINNHINEPLYIDGDAILGFIARYNQQHIGSSTPETRIIKRGSLYRRLLELITIDDFGIRVIRPHPGSVTAGVTDFLIHNGTDRREQIVFSHDTGDLKRAKYLWSNKGYKTDAYIVSTFIESRIVSTVTGYNKRILYVDASDIDSQYQEWPTGTDRTNLIAAIDVRGRDGIASSLNTNIISADISSTTKFRFRTDYQVGDLVTVKGNYDAVSAMRVTEYAEFQDEKGETGYPTLSVLVEEV